MKTFAELYCARHALPPEGFERAVLRRCLHRRAWLVGLTLRMFAADFFAPDLELVRSVGRLRRNHDFDLEVESFRHHPDNQHWLRRHLRLRISIRRLRRVLRETFADGAAGRRAAEPRGLR